MSCDISGSSRKPRTVHDWYSPREVFCRPRKSHFGTGLVDLPESGRDETSPSFSRKIYRFTSFRHKTKNVETGYVSRQRTTGQFTVYNGKVVKNVGYYKQIFKDS